ncbi:MAG: glycosyltransferase family 2 protein [Propionicimonas sp.]
MHPAPTDSDLVELVIPCLNEEVALPALLAGVPSGWAVIVVDNGSGDRTAEVAGRAGATVVHEPRPGYGAAVDRGLRAATRDIVVVLDGDGSIRPGDLTAMVDQVVAGRVDLCCGTRQPVTRSAWPVHAQLGNRVLAATLSLALGLALHDIAPVRVARRSALLELGIADRRFGYPLETLLRARAAGWLISEHPIPYHPRNGGQSKVTGSIRGTLRALRDFSGVLVTNRDLLRSWPK